MRNYFNIFRAAALAVMSLAISCKPESKIEKPAVTPPSMSSFKFEAAKNAGIIISDAVGEINGQDVVVMLPKTADLTKLVATFELGDGNIVKVGEVEQESGVTANDFTVPVDYFVSNSDGTKNAIYSVKVNGVNGEWKILATYSELPVKSAEMKVNPADGLPYIAFKENLVATTPSESANKMTVLKYAGEGFSNVGNAGFSEQMSGSVLDLDFDIAGLPYIVYQLGTGTKPGVVMKYDAGSWKNLDAESGSDMNASQVRLGVLSDKNIVMAQINNNKKSTFGRNSFVVSDYNGNAWTNNTVTSVEKNPVFKIEMCSGTEAVYVALIYKKIVGGVNYGHEVLRYRDGAWSSLRSNYLHEGATQTGIFVLDIDAAGDDVFLMTADNAEDNTAYHFRVEKYSSETQSWSAVGTPVPYVHGDSHDLARIAVAPDGTPYVAYYDSKNTTVFVTDFDRNTKQWSEPVSVVTESVSNLCIDFSKAGVGYLSFTDANGAEKLYIYK